MNLITLTVAEYQELRDKLDTIQKFIEQTGKSNDQELWLDSRSICKILQISLRTLQKLRDEGKIPFNRLSGGIIRYRSSDIDLFMNQNYVSSQKEGQK